MTFDVSRRLNHNSVNLEFYAIGDVAFICIVDLTLPATEDWQRGAQRAGVLGVSCALE